MEGNAPKNQVARVSAAIEQLEPYRNQIVEWMEKSGMSIFLVHKKLAGLMVEVSLSSVQRFVGKLRKAEVYIPVLTAPGEEAQVDYGYLGEFIRDGKKIKVWVFIMVLSYSRYAFYSLATEQTAQSFIHSHRCAFEFFGGTPVTVKIDNLGAGVMEADFYQSSFRQVYTDFLDHYGVTAVNARICRGQDKGKVEAGVKYVKLNFLPTVSNNSFETLEKELAEWNRDICNRRLHGTTRKIPEQVFIKEEKLQLFSLPPEGFKLIEKEQRKVDLYGHIYFRYNFYSVPHHFAGQELTIEISDKILQVFNGTSLITTHLIHPGKGRFITLNCHKPYHKQARTDLYYLEETRKIGSQTERVYELLRASKPYHWKNMVKGILRLKEVYSTRVIEAACLQAMEEGEHDYKRIRQICLTTTRNSQVKEPRKIPKHTNGYYHELSIYDTLVNKTA